MTTGRKNERADYDATLEEGMDIYEEALSEASDILEEFGLGVTRDAPTYHGERYLGHLPSSRDIKEMDMDGLVELLQVSTEWSDYTGTLAAIFESEKSRRSHELTLVRAKIRKTKSGAKSDKDDDVEVDSRYLRANAALLAASEKFRIADHASTCARRDREFVSRTITARSADMEAGGRKVSVSRDEPGARLRRDRQGGKR
jgi:hypothetical protein